MKRKFLLLAYSLGVLMACNKEGVAVPQTPQDLPAVGEITTESIPVHLYISTGIQTRGTSVNDKEDEILNAILTVKGYDEENKVIYTDNYDVSGSSNIIVNLKPCTRAAFIVQSGSVKDGVILTALEEQKTHYYAKGEISMEWDDLQAEGATHVIELVRQINKITIDKISVDWNNASYDAKEFRVKRMYLCDVPRYPETSYEEVPHSIYKEGFTGTKVDFKYYNFNGLEVFRYKPNNVTYVGDIFRLDEQLLDEMDVVISKAKPYDTQHVFYSYICNNALTVPKVDFMQGDRYAFTVPMTTIVLEAEMDGSLMYYRFPILKMQEGVASPVPVNTHFRFKELIIKDLGSPTLYGDKTFENVNFTLVDWTDDIRTDASENI